MGLASEALTPSSARELSPDDLLDGRYRCLKRLGGGGMGEVYEVEHARLKRRFALKLLRPELAGQHELVARFDREARAVAALHSEHVVSIVDSGSLDDGRPYLVMERLVGQDLKQVLSGVKELPVARAVNIGIDVCLGLHAAHAAGLVHRDLKPENVFVTQGDDRRELCKLLDFGVVQLAEQEQTRPGVLLGTARYMAPEQVKSGERVTPAADLFALGVILYRCLLGEHPFAADTVERVLFRILHDTPGPLPPHLPRDLVRLITQAMAKLPSERPASALDFARELAHFTHGARTLEGVTAGLVDTVVVEGGPTLTGADVTPALGNEEPAPPRNRSEAKPWLVVATLSIAAALGVGWALSRERALPPAAPTMAPPVPARAPSAATLEPTPATPEPTPPPSDPNSVAPVRERRPAASSVPPPAATASAANKVSGPRASASEPAPSAVPGLNWFDPRNPYAR